MNLVQSELNSLIPMNFKTSKIKFIKDISRKFK